MKYWGLMLPWISMAIAMPVALSLFGRTKMPPCTDFALSALTVCLVGLVVYVFSVVTSTLRLGKVRFEMLSLVNLIALCSCFSLAVAESVRWNRSTFDLEAKYGAVVGWNQSIDKLGHWEVKVHKIDRSQITQLMFDLARLDRVCLDISSTDLNPSDIEPEQIPKGLLLILFHGSADPSIRVEGVNDPRYSFSKEEFLCFGR